MDHDRIEELIAELRLEPVEMLHVAVVDGAVDLDFIRHASLVAANPHPIDLVRPATRAHVRMLHVKGAYVRID